MQQCSAAAHGSVAVQHKTTRATTSTQHKATYHACNEAQTKLITCFSAFTDPRSRDPHPQGHDLKLLLLCCVNSLPLFPFIFPSFSFLIFFSFPLPVSHSFAASYLPLSSSLSLSVTPLPYQLSLSIAWPHSLSVLADSISCGLSRVTCLILLTGHMAFLTAPLTKKGGFWEFL